MFCFISHFPPILSSSSTHPISQCPFPYTSSNIPETFNRRYKSEFINLGITFEWNFKVNGVTPMWFSCWISAPTVQHANYDSATLENALQTSLVAFLSIQSKNWMESSGDNQWPFCREDLFECCVYFILWNIERLFNAMFMQAQIFHLALVLIL